VWEVEEGQEAEGGDKAEAPQPLPSLTQSCLLGPKEWRAVKGNQRVWGGAESWGWG
jgi:hypothetical protein